MRRRGVYFRLLASNPSFRRLWIAQLISLGGDWFNVVALTGLLLHLTGSSFYGGAVLAASLLPQFLLSPVAGVVADRFDRRRLMLGANLIAAVLALAMLAVRSPGSVWLGLAAMAGIAATGAFFDPASRSGLPNIVEGDQLGAANVLMASTWGVMAAVGAAAGGLVAGLLGRDTAFVANAASFLISAGLILGVRAPLGPLGLPGERRRRLRPVQDLREGAAWARADPRVMALLAQKVGFGLGTGMIGLLPVFAAQIFAGQGPGGSPEAAIGVLYAARGLGSLLGPFGARVFVGADLRRLYPAIAAAMALFGGAYALFPAAPGLWAAAGIVLVAHLGGGTQYTMTSYGLQQITPDRVRGRIMAFELGLVTLSMSASFLAAGRAAEVVNPRAVVEVLSGLTVAYAAVWALATRRLWKQPAPALGDTLAAPGT
jgi:predicted MFS family arabinose efflux permease